MPINTDFGFSDQMVLINKRSGSARLGIASMEGEHDLPPPPLHDVLKTKNINAYRTLTLLRMGCLFFLLKYRFSNPLQDNAFLIWFLAGCCEVMFVVNFLAYTVLKWRPVERKTYLDRLSSRYEKSGEPSKLQAVDVFITTAEPWKEPPIVTANTILSVLAVDYPIDKVTCYVSDDSASPITFSMMLEVSRFALKWVPFCKRFSVEPRAPAAFFSFHTEEASASEESSDFNSQWKALKQEYETLKSRVNCLAKSPEQALKFAREHTSWPTDNPRDHPPIIEVIIPESNTAIEGCESPSLPLLVYVAREKAAGCRHNFKAGAMNALLRVSEVFSGSPFILNLDCDMYINDSKALRHVMCFFMDPNLGETVAFVQFPQVFGNVDEGDLYGNRIVFLYDVLLKGLDGIQGPYYCGTGCVHRRTALRGYKPGLGERLKGNSSEQGFSPILQQSALSGLGRGQIMHNSSILKAALDLCSCHYEGNSSWGKKIGWRYGSSAEDALTGFKIHCLGWRSIYFWPTRPAFKGVAPAIALDRLAQRKRIACGLVNILLSRSSPLFYGFQRLMFLQRIAYLYDCMFYAGISVLVVLYAILHAACLLSAKSLTPKISDPESIWFLSAMCFQHGMSFLEFWWASHGSFQQWWNDERFWWISNASCFLLGTLEAFFISIGLLETGFSVTPKSSETDNASPYEITSSPLFISLVMLVMMFSVATVTAAALVINGGTESFNYMCGELLCGMWSLVILYPILSQLLKVRKGIDKVPLSVMLPSVIGTIVFCVMVNTYIF